MKGQTTRTVCLEGALADLPRVSSHASLAADLSDLAVKWARRHGALMGALWLADEYIGRGDIDGARQRIAAAMAKDAEHDA